MHEDLDAQSIAAAPFVEQTDLGTQFMGAPVLVHADLEAQSMTAAPFIEEADFEAQSVVLASAVLRQGSHAGAHSSAAALVIVQGEVVDAHSMLP